MLGRKLSLLLITMLMATTSHACMSDIDCSYNQTCVKAKYNHNIVGTCTVKDVASKTYGVKSVEGYVTPSQCGWDETFVKESGDIYGLCVKR